MVNLITATVTSEGSGQELKFHYDTWRAAPMLMMHSRCLQRCSSSSQVVVFLALLILVFSTMVQGVSPLIPCFDDGFYLTHTSGRIPRNSVILTHWKLPELVGPAFWRPPAPTTAHRVPYRQYRGYMPKSKEQMTAMGELAARFREERTTQVHQKDNHVLRYPIGFDAWFLSPSSSAKSVFTVLRVAITSYNLTHIFGFTHTHTHTHTHWHLE